MNDARDPRAGMAALDRVWHLPPGMAIDVDREFFAALAWLDETSVLFGSVGEREITNAAKKLAHVQGVRVTDHMNGRITIYRPESREASDK